MVVDQLWDRRADRIFNALGDPTRRDIVRRALHGEHTVSSLARHYPMSFAAVQKHVAVLERAGLVSKARRGREQLVRTDISTIRRATRLLEQLEALWRDRMDRFGDALVDD
jgi:DNA-binding transcriptional ArsR family regulator